MYRFPLEPSGCTFRREKVANLRSATELYLTAGEGIRTLDVQLGKNDPVFADWFSKPVITAS